MNSSPDWLHLLAFGMNSDLTRQAISHLLRLTSSRIRTLAFLCILPRRDFVNGYQVVGVRRERTTPHPTTW